MEEVRGSSPLAPLCDESGHVRQMSRIIVYALAIGRGVFLLVAPITAVGVDGVGAEDLARGEVHDGDPGLIGAGKDPAVGVGAPTPR